MNFALILRGVPLFSRGVLGPLEVLCSIPFGESSDEVCEPVLLIVCLRAISCFLVLLVFSHGNAYKSMSILIGRLEDRTCRFTPRSWLRQSESRFQIRLSLHRLFRMDLRLSISSTPLRLEEVFHYNATNAAAVLTFELVGLLCCNEEFVLALTRHIF